MRSAPRRTSTSRSTRASSSISATTAPSTPPATSTTGHTWHTSNVPAPAHPPLPSQPALNQEARYVWRELLAARHLIRRAPSLSARPHILIPTGVNGPIAAPLPPLSTPASSSAERAHGLSTVTVALLAALVSLAVFASTILLPVPRRGRATLGWLEGSVSSTSSADEPWTATARTSPDILAT